MIERISMSRLARAAHGELGGPDAQFGRIAIDSRTVSEGDLFVAIPGERVDGHDFVVQAASAGASGVLVQREVSADVASLRVDDTVLALGALGQLLRDDYEGVLVGVTGSAGKTTAKNMIAAVLAQAGPTVATEGNQNNEIGVPLTLQRLDRDTEFAVVEMGAAKPDDIAYLCGIARPNVSVLLNAGTAHLEAYRDEAELAATKGQIVAGMDADELAVINADQSWSDGWKQRAEPARCVTFGLSDSADYRAVDIQQRGFAGSRFSLVGRQGPRVFETMIPGLPGIYNALAAIAVGSELGVSDAAIQRGLVTVLPAAGRGAVVAGRNDTHVIDDCYNANPEALRAALLLLSQVDGPRALILGAMAELGPRSAELHREIAGIAAEAGVGELITVGAEALPAADAFPGNATHFENTTALLQSRPQFAPGSTVLVKGSRSIGLESVVEALRSREEGIAC